MKCLKKFKWVKLPRHLIPNAKGLLGAFLRLASRAAFRKGWSIYCGHQNPVEPGMWAGGIVGIKSITGIRSRQKAIETLDRLQELGYITYTLDAKTKLLTYRITDWVSKCSGSECPNGNVYVTPGYGFLCMPRDITERLAKQEVVFGEADAWLDLWCHTVFRDYGNAFSFLAPAVQFGKYGSVLTLETLGNRWGWEKTKVWRFFRKYADTFSLTRLPGAYGCVIFNLSYPGCEEHTRPTEELVMEVLELIRRSARNTRTRGTDHERLNRYVAWKSRRVIQALRDGIVQNQHNDQTPSEEVSEARVALSALITRAYISQGRNCKICRNCIYDCRSVGLEAENIFQKVVTPSWEQEWHLGEVMTFGTDDLGEGFG